jgi:hypothetical protein
VAITRDDLQDLPAATDEYMRQALFGDGQNNGLDDVMPGTCTSKTFDDFKNTVIRCADNCDVVQVIDDEVAFAGPLEHLSDDSGDIYAGSQPSDDVMKEQWGEIQQGLMESLDPDAGDRYTGTILEVDADLGHVIQSSANKLGAITHDAAVFGDKLPQVGQKVTVQYSAPDQAKWVDRTPEQGKDKGMAR